jgi:hypothetical protein
MTMIFLCFAISRLVFFQRLSLCASLDQPGAMIAIR